MWIPALVGSAATLFVAQESSTWRQYASPEQVGFASEALAEAWEAADRAGSGAVLVAYRGHVLVAWGEIERRYECHSVRKSLMSALMGLAVARGELALDASLASLGVDDLQGLTDAEKRATVVDVLASRSGIYHPAAKEPADMRAERPARGSHAPGEFFFYNNWDFNLCGALWERSSGSGVAAGFEREIARPLGMEDFRTRDVFAELAPSSSRYPAHAFRMSARDLARFGELYRNRGTWNGRELLPASWIERSTRATDGRDYGLLWWTYPAGSLASYPALNAHDLFAAIGTGGQLLLVVPGAELVFVHRANTDAEREVGGAQCWAIAERILAARTGAGDDEPELGPLHVEPFSDPDPAPPDREPTAVDPAAFEPLTGEYDFGALRVQVFVHERRLFGRLGDGSEHELLPLSPTHFYQSFPNTYEVEFLLDDAGRARAARLTTPRGASEGRRVEGPG